MSGFKIGFYKDRGLNDNIKIFTTFVVSYVQ